MASFHVEVSVFRDSQLIFSLICFRNTKILVVYATLTLPAAAAYP